MDGRIIDHYKLLEKLGAGGMGEIYKAEDTRLHRVVAVKVLSPSVAADPERRRRFLQEAQASSALNHPNIITVYDIVLEGETQCIVMEYVAGKTLREMIPSGGLPVPQALQYAVQMASALAAAHAAMIIHRDLKPSNVMITPSNLIKILDFGLAKWIEPPEGDEQSQLTREGAVLGTVSYMSPEQAEGKRVDARSDIFAFGSVLYEMLTGRRAFEGSSGISTLSAILRDDVTPIYQVAPDVPPLLEQIVLRCLQKDPAARWPTMKQVEGALASLQRQLDPAGQYAPPLSTLALSDSPSSVSIAPSVAPASPNPSSVAGAPSAAPPSVPARPSAAPPSAAASIAAPPSVPPPTVGPHSGPPPASSASAPPPAAGVGPAGPPPAPPPSRPGSRKIAAAIVFGLVGVVLLAGAGVGFWYFRNHSAQNKNTQVATVQPPQPTAAAPETPPPPQATPDNTNPAANAIPPLAPLPPEPAAAPKKVAKAPKKTAPESLKSTAPAPVAPVPAPVAPPVAPQQEKIEAPKPVKPAPPRPQTVPAMIPDGMPFRMTLAQDVPANAPDGSDVRFIVADDLRNDDKIVVIAKGATVTGKVAAAGGKKFLGVGGKKTSYELETVEAVDGKKLTVRALAGRNPEGPVLHAFETPNGRKAKGYAALQGTEYIAYTEGDQTVSVKK